MSETDQNQRDPREKRKPKDSEFYQIPPDLKKEFDMIMAGKLEKNPPVEEYTRALKRRKNLALASFLFGILGSILIGLGPILAISLGLAALRTGKRAQEGQVQGFDPAKFGILLGVLMLLANAVLLYLLGFFGNAAAA